MKNKMKSKEEKLRIQTRDAYNWLAKDYDTEWGSHIDTEISSRFLELVSPGGLVLDVGCGPGQYSLYFSGKGLQVIGIDFSAKMLRIAKRNWRGARIAEMDMSNLGFADSVFDALWVCASSPHIPEARIPQVLYELGRVLKSGGLLLINSTISSQRVRIETAKEMGDYNREGRFFQRYSNQMEFEEYLHEAGFNVIDTITRKVSSDILKNAPRQVNIWANFFCRLQ